LSESDDIDSNHESDLDARARIGYDAVINAADRYRAGEIDLDALTAVFVAQEIPPAGPSLRVPINEAGVPRIDVLYGLTMLHRKRILTGADYDRVLDALVEKHRLG
jgi:hypothetical protein